MADRGSTTAITIGDEAVHGMGKTIFPVEISADVENNTVQIFYITAKLALGQKPILYNEIYINIFSVSNQSFYYYDNSSTNCTNMVNTSVYRVEPLLKGQKYSYERLNEEDLIQFCLVSNETFSENDKYTFLFSTIGGTKTVIDGKIPLTSENKNYKIYP